MAKIHKALGWSRIGRPASDRPLAEWSQVGYVFLGAAIAFEVTATLSLKATEGFSRWPLATVTVLGYVAAFAMLSLALDRAVPLGVAYGIWSAIGVACVAALSIPLFGESLSAIQVFGIALVLAGVVAIEAGG